MLTRRTLVVGAAALGFAGRAQAADSRWNDLAPRFTEVERASGGRLGVAVLDTRTGRRVDHRGAERFPLCSTAKLPLVAAVLARVDAGQETLERIVHYDTSALLPYAPVTDRHVADGLSVGALCAAAIGLSDNTAANLLLASIGGPPALTRFFRAIGDPVSRLDRTEPTLNEATPGDPRDTTTPAAMLTDIRTLVLGDALSPASKARLKTWLRACETDARLLRAALPASWALGDKTGSGDHGSTNDVGLIWPPGRPPVLIAVYLTQTAATRDKREAAIADVGRAVVAAVG